MQNEQKPLVSVLMTVYNREKYIAEAIQSIINSTYQNWELIIVDDCSKDNSLNIAKSFEKSDNRITIYKNEKNLGDYPNRNKAASYAKGKYLKYIDADDAIYPFGLERMVYYMERYPEAAYGICRHLNPKKMYPVLYTNKETIKKHFIEKSFLTNAPGSVIIRTKCFREIGGFTNFRHISDNLLWVRLALQYSIIVLPHCMNWARGHEDQELERRKSKIKPIVLLYSYQRMLLKSKLSPLDNLDTEIAIKILDKKYLKGVFSKLKSWDFNKAYILYKFYKTNYNETLN